MVVVERLEVNWEKFLKEDRAGWGGGIGVGNAHLAQSLAYRPSKMLLNEYRGARQCIHM